MMMSQTLTLICRDETFEYAPSAMHLDKIQSSKIKTNAIASNKIKLTYRSSTFEYTPEPPSVLTYYREERPINWRFRIPPKNTKKSIFLFLLSVLTWKSY
ncbi:MAG: hypothetical protein ACRC2R_03030 [Xenococcaceae cyanobacterium]